MQPTNGNAPPCYCPTAPSMQGSATSAISRRIIRAAGRRVVLSGTSRVTGTLVSLQGYALTLLTRSGTRVAVDATQAAANQRSALLVIGDGYTVIVPAGATPLRATSITRAKPGMGASPPDQSP